MSTPRKRWFKVADAWIRSEWDDATMATVARLMAWLNQRYARDAIPPSESGNAKLFKEDAMAISRVRSSTRRCFETLILRLKTADLETLTWHLVEHGQHTYLEISWPKFPEFQEYGSRSPGKSRGSDRPGEGAYPTPISDLRSPAPPLREEKNPSFSPLAPGPVVASAQAPKPSEKVPKKLRAGVAPDQLPEAAIQALEKWTRENLPSELPNVRTHIDACLDHFRANGKLMADWTATCRNWIRRAPEMRRAPARGAPTPPAVKRKHTPEEIDAAARRWREEAAERRARAMRP